MATTTTGTHALRTIPLLLALAGGVGCAEQKAKATAPPPTVIVTPVVQRDVPIYIEAVSNLDGYVNAEIRARVRGFLQAQKYKDGAVVKEGQLLFQIEPNEYAAAVATAQANVARAKTAQEHGNVQLDRRKALLPSGVVSKQELDDATATAHDADGQLAAAQAQLQQALLNLSYTQIHSPVTGVAGLALVRIGNLVGQNDATLLTTVSQVDPIRVNFPVSETDYVKAPERLKHLDGRDLAWAEKQFKALDSGGTAEGDPGLELVLSDGSVYAHRGVIVAANRQVDASTGTIQLQALFPNPDNGLRPGQYGRVRMRRTDAGSNALVVPDKAVIQVQGTYSLAVVGDDNKVQLRRVEAGPSAGDMRVIMSGVKVGERVVVEGLQKANDGVLVAPQSVPSAPPAQAAASAKP
jgi:membrane fusion protein (multidrug efflux system)